MKIYTIHTGLSNNYLVQTDEGKTLLIDCSCSLKDLTKLTDRLDAIVITHGHFDHIATLQEVQQHFGCKVYMHPKAVAKLNNTKLNASRFFGCFVTANLPKACVQPLQAGEQTIAGVPVTAYWVPGHTDCSVMLQIAGAMFTGDFVFADSYGRTDLPTGDFRAMQTSLSTYRPMLKNYTCYWGH